MEVYGVNSSAAILTKEDLTKGNCCRLCGVKSRDPFEISISFIPLFEDCDKAAKYGMPLFKLVNSWLPLTLSPEDSYYPRSICATCFYRMEDTISFFQQILIGQRQLVDAINKKSMLKEQPSLKYDTQSEMTKLARRRGRPRKDKSLMEDKTKVSPLQVSLSDDVNSLSVAARKQKRCPKPPQRFGELYVNQFSKKAKEDTEDVEENGNADAPAKPEDTPVGTGTKPETVSFAAREFTTVRRLDFQLDLNKLDVLMDGDEETVAETVEVEVVQAPVSVETELQPEPQPAQDPPDSSPRETPPVSQDDADGLDFEKEVKKRRRRKRHRRRRVNLNVTKRYPCSYELCSKAFTTISARRYHIEREHEPKIRHFCPTCQKGFTHTRLLKYHIQTHAPQPTVCCKQCPKVFKSASSLFTHRKTCHAAVVERIQCEVENCTESFTLKSSLKAHMRIHEGIRPHVCAVCEKAFTQMSNLKAHERIHNGLRPFQCSMPSCSKSFKTRTQLKIHEGSHAESKPHLCPTCGKGFRTQSSFRSHMSSHLEIKAHGCTMCEKRFSTPRALRLHTAIHGRADGKPTVPSGLICFCGLEFPNRKTLLTHSRICKHESVEDQADSTQDQEGIVVDVSDAELVDYSYGISVLETAEEQIIDCAAEEGDIQSEDADFIQMEIYNPEGIVGLEESTEPVRYYLKIPRCLLGLVDENLIVQDTDS